MSDVGNGPAVDGDGRVLGDEVKDCGLIMPIAECDGCSPAHWLEVRTILESAVAQIDKPKFRAKMVSEGEDTSVIHGRIVQNVYSNEIVICDVSGRNPNVLFELGLRIAFDRPVVLIKDDATAFAFDIGPLEHLVYPRGLRHGPIETFKTLLARKVSATHRDWYAPKNGGKPSYIEAFGPITTVQFENKTERSDLAILRKLEEISDRVDRFEVTMRTENRSVDLSPGDAAQRAAQKLGLMSGKQLAMSMASKTRARLGTAFKLKLQSGLQPDWVKERLRAELGPAADDLTDAEIVGLVSYFVGE